MPSSRQRAGRYSNAVVAVILAFGLAAFLRRRRGEPQLPVPRQPSMKPPDRPRPAASVLVIILLGAGLSVLGGALGYSGLRPPAPPPGTLSTIGFSATSPTDVEDFLADMKVTVDGCRNPVEVALLIRPSAQAWASYALPPRTLVSKVALVVTGPISHLKVRTGSLYQDENGLISTDVPLGQYPAAVTAPRDPQAFHGGDVYVGTGPRHYALSRGFVADWARTHISLYYTFQADWLRQRTSGSLIDTHASSCYLSLPSITGPGAESADVNAVHGTGSQTELPDTTPATLADGAVFVASKQALFDGGDSSPGPADSIPAGEVWDCQLVGMPPLGSEENAIKVTTPGLLQFSASGVPFWEAANGPEAGLINDPIAGYNANAPADCAAAAAFTNGESSTVNAFSLVIAGALLGLGLTVVFEEIVRSMRKRLDGHAE